MNYTNSIDSDSACLPCFTNLTSFDVALAGPRPSSRTLLFTTFISLRKQPTFGNASTGFPAKKKRAQKFHTGMSHYPDLGVTRHQYGISVLVSQTSLMAGKPVVALPNVGSLFTWAILLLVVNQS